MLRVDHGGSFSATGAGFAPVPDLQIPGVIGACIHFWAFNVKQSRPLVVTFPFLFPFLIHRCQKFLSIMPKRKRAAADVLDTAEEMGLESLADSNITGERVYSEIQYGTDINYIRMLDLWDE